MYLSHFHIFHCDVSQGAIAWTLVFSCSSESSVVQA
jgi:hypothetical protein